MRKETKAIYNQKLGCTKICRLKHQKEEHQCPTNAMLDQAFQRSNINEQSVSIYY